MRTPDGKECPLYYADFHRGRHVQECRAHYTPDSAHWQPNDCARCQVPDILRANASPTLKLTLKLSPGILGLGRRLDVIATCTRHGTAIADPFVGCEQCNAVRPGLSAFLDALERDTPPDQP